MSHSPLERLRHIRDECDFLSRHVVTHGRDRYDADPLASRAVERSLAIIGEAVKHVPEAVRIRTALIEWRKIAGMRDRLIHDYAGTDHDLVWDVLETKIPPLHAAVNQLIAGLESERHPPLPADAPAN